MNRKNITEQNPFAIKDVLVISSANNTKHDNLVKKEKIPCEIYPFPYTEDHFIKETKCKYRTILLNTLVRHLFMCSSDPCYIWVMTVYCILKIKNTLYDA